MRAGSLLLRPAGLWSQVLLCVLIAVAPVGPEACATDTAPAAPGRPATTPAPTGLGLSAAPPAGNLEARLVWARMEAERLRSFIAMNPRDEPSRVLLAALAVVVATDLEQALSVGDLESAAGMRKLIEQRLAGTRWRLDSIARRGAGGGFHALAVMSLHGILRPRDIETACRLFAAAWDTGFAGSAYRLWECSADSDPARSAALLLAAANSGHATAREQLGRRCLEAMPRDLPCASIHIAAAAAAGRASAKSLLAWMLLQGVGTGSDPARARALYLEAANAGDLSAKNNLGELHETGRGVAVDAGRAVVYYREAAEAGFAPAQFNLGRMYAAGIGVTRDVDKARSLLLAALKEGIQPAQKILDWLDGQAPPARR